MDGDETDAPNSAAPRPAKILLVDAEPRVTDRLRRQIEREGLEGLEASDLHTLREQLACQPEVVFLDLELEQSSGLELIGEIRARSPGSEIVVMTPFASIDSDVACAGVRDSVEKPLADPGEVVRATRRALERRRLRVVAWR